MKRREQLVDEIAGPGAEGMTPAGLIDVDDQVLAGGEWRTVAVVAGASPPPGSSRARIHLRCDDGSSWLAERGALRHVRPGPARAGLVLVPPPAP